MLSTLRGMSTLADGLPAMVRPILDPITSTNLTLIVNIFFSNSDLLRQVFVNEQLQEAGETVQWAKTMLSDLNRPPQ